MLIGSLLILNQLFHLPIPLLSPILLREQTLIRDLYQHPNRGNPTRGGGGSAEGGGGINHNSFHEN